MLKSLLRSMWGAPPRRGLRVATVGFLIAGAGALAAFCGGVLRDAGMLHILSLLLLYLGWALLIFGTALCFVGIIVGWWFLFYRLQETMAGANSPSLAVDHRCL